MDPDTKLPSRDNIVPFPGEERARRATEREKAVPESLDHGPSPEESLRIMRAFVGIKSRKVRKHLIDMLEGASRTRGQAGE